MAFIRLAAAVVLATALLGCQNKSKSLPVAPPASEETLRSIRASYQQTDPGARVGLVTAVSPQTGLAAVGDMPVKDFNEGDVITFIDSRQNIVNVGQVVNITPDSLHVRYRTPGAGQRAPQAGDLAVRLTVK